ncbi:MAG: hypothetical protein ABR559_02755 [Gemmatimonadota bacterium]
MTTRLRTSFVALAFGAGLFALCPRAVAAQGPAHLAASQGTGLRGDPPIEPAAPDRWLGPDKPIHVFAGWWVGAAAYGAAAAADAEPAERRLAAAAASLAAGIAKETFDATVQGEPFSWKDLAADAAGLAALLAFTLAAES